MTKPPAGALIPACRSTSAGFGPSTTGVGVRVGLFVPVATWLFGTADGVTRECDTVTGFVAAVGGVDAGIPVRISVPTGLPTAGVGFEGLEDVCTGFKVALAEIESVDDTVGATSAARPPLSPIPLDVLQPAAKRLIKASPIAARESGTAPIIGARLGFRRSVPSSAQNIHLGVATEKSTGHGIGIRQTQVDLNSRFNGEGDTAPFRTPEAAG